jgi:hypothetical protein
VRGRGAFGGLHDDLLVEEADVAVDSLFRHEEPVALGVVPLLTDEGVAELFLGGVVPGDAEVHLGILRAAIEHVEAAELGVGDGDASAPTGVSPEKLGLLAGSDLLQHQLGPTEALVFRDVLCGFLRV